MPIEFWLQLAGMAGMVGAAYAAIRSDLVRAIMRADHAHERLDDHMRSHHA